MDYRRSFRRAQNWTHSINRLFNNRISNARESIIHVNFQGNGAMKSPVGLDGEVADRCLSEIFFRCL